MSERIISNPKDLVRCAKCVMPETQESIMFNGDGVCNICRNVEFKDDKIDWVAKKNEFLDLISKYKGKYEYDCIVPFSGGKDSTYTLYSLVVDYGLKPLVVSYDHHMYRPQTVKNREKTLKKLGVDFVSYRTNWHLVKDLMRVGLERKGNIYWYEETGIFAYPMHMAIKFNVPFVIWGEPSAEYSAYYDYDDSEEVDETRFNMFVNMGITAQDMVGFLDNKDFTLNDLKFHIYPDRGDLKKIGCRSVCLGSYQPWDVKRQVEVIKKEIGWEGDHVEGVSQENNYEKVEDMLQGVQDYLKYIKRGYGRMSHLLSIDIRNGRLTREKALEMLDKWEGLRPASLDVLLGWLGIDEEKFYEITKRHTVKPWSHNPENTKKGEPLPDMKYWVK